MSRVALLVGMIVFVSSASAQVVYEPVQYQYRAGDVIYYYGGSNPLVHVYAQDDFDHDCRQRLSTQPQPVYTDTWSRGFRDARLIGCTPTDAMNESRANLPRYFTMRDQLAGAVRKDGAWVVPAQPRPLRTYRYNRMETSPPTHHMPRPLMIIPKDSLQKPQAASQVVAAN